MGHVSIYIEDDPDTKEFAYRVAFTGPPDFEHSAAHRAAVHLSEFLDEKIKAAGGHQLEAEPDLLPGPEPTLPLYAPPSGVVRL